jgi:hypothetical protein
LVRPARLERAACGFEVRRSIRLSYGRTVYPSYRKKSKISKEIERPIEMMEYLLKQRRGYDMAGLR